MGSRQMTRLSADQLKLLRRLNEGWRPLWLQVGKAGRALERKRMVRVDYGPDDSPDQNKLCCYLAEAGRGAFSAMRDSTNLE
jgi:hypothetical protein